MTNHMNNEIQRYRKPTIVFHWAHGISFVLLFLTGLVLFVPPLAILAQDGWTRLIHRISAVVFFVGPFIYLLFNWKLSIKGLKDAFIWGKDDIGWLKAAPRYYFLCDEGAMPPQGHLNSGQKMWWLLVIISSIVFVISGAIMWFAKGNIPSETFQFMVLMHDTFFIAIGLMFFVHIYMSVVHPLVRPLSTGSWSSMTKGTVSVEYARSHYCKWYDEVCKNSEENSEEVLLDSDIVKELEKWVRQENHQLKWPQFYLDLFRIQSEAKRRIIVPAILSQETVDERIRNGIPLISFAELDIDWPRLQETFEKIINLTVTYKDLFDQIPHGINTKSSNLLTRDVVKAWMEDSELPNIPSGISTYFWWSVIHAALAPVLVSYSKNLIEKINQDQWRRNFCPICGGKPDMAILEKENGARWLVCSHCDAQWLFQRLECPYCGCEDQSALAYYNDEKGFYHLYTCEKCKRYIKAIDLRQAETEILIPLERVLTLHIDRQAREFGYICGSSK